MELRANPRRRVDDESVGQRGSADTGAVSVAQRARQAERQQPEERRAAPEVHPILAVEGCCVAARSVDAGIQLLAARAAVALAAPVHRVPLAPEAVAMSEYAAPDHWSDSRPGRR